MTTRLDKTLKREVDISGVPYIITFSPEGMKIVEKGKRKGQELSWGDLISGKVAVEKALKDSIALVKDQDQES